MMHKPVVMLGKAPFMILPSTMVRYVDSLDNLPKEIVNLMEYHTHHEDALQAYIAAVVQSSVPVNFYSQLLGRKNVYSVNSADNFEEEINKLAYYVEKLLAEKDTFFYHKTTNRRLYDQEYQKAKTAGFFEVIFENERKIIISAVLIDDHATYNDYCIRSNRCN